MAKLSSINKNERRKKLVKNIRRYARLKAIADDTSADDGDRLMARLKLAESLAQRQPDPRSQPLRNNGSSACILSQVPALPYRAA